ncbi:uncharacterized protein [Parasteatoda tepidariorum]|nr:uncharacterized protein LOC107451979 isoform X2 [Parasteatoda tepidariorum]
MIEPTVEEVETQFRNLENNLAFENPIDVERIDPPTYRNQIQIEEIQTSSIPKEKEQINRISESEREVYGPKSYLDKSSMYTAVIFKIIYMLGTSILGVVWFILKIIFKLLRLWWNSKSEGIDKFAIDEDNQEAIEKALLQENEAFSFGSSNKEKNVDEEKLSFKYPPNSFLNNKDSKYHIQNDLTESDNEENESLEEFWKRADIKLVQRLRMLQKNSPHY